MQLKSTQKHSGYLCTKIIVLALIFFASSQFSFAQEIQSKFNKLSPVQKAQQRSKTLQAGQGNPTANNDAGILSKASTEINNPQATCTSWAFSITAGDPPTSLRAFRDGVPKTCAAPGTCTPGIGGAFNYQIFQWVNPVAQCVTVTYNATNASFSFVTVHNAPPTLTNLCANWVGDPGSSATPGTPIVFSFNGTAGTTYYFLVTNVGAPPSNGTIQVDANVCSSTPCAGTPNPGNTTGPVSACPTVPFTLGLQTPQNFAGITYQWELSTTGVGGPWSNAPGASTSSTYTTSITVATAYRCRVTCTNSAITTISNPINVTVTPPSGCYCAGGANDVIDEKISRVRYATIDNASSSQAGYEDFTAVSTTVIQGSTLPITVDISNFFAGDLVRVWIDFNQNGSWLDPGERVVATVTSVNPGVGTITIPVTAAIGPTRMRVRMYWQPSDPDPGPCGNTAYGQVEDYTVNIQPCIQGVFNTHPANQTIQCGGTANFSVTTAGSLLTYGWEYKTSAASPFWLNVSNGGVYSGATTSTLTITNAPQTMNGYVYRATIIGPCTAIDFSNVATLTVGPYIVTVNPSSATICTGTLLRLDITNLVSAPTTTTFSSGPISIQIPDVIGPPASSNAVVEAGINHSIPVVLPAGSAVLGIDVRLNITHTYSSDLKIVLKNSTTNQVLNLFYHKSGAQTPGANFTNTVISSAGTVRFSAVPPPFTGTFRADLEMNPGSYGDAGGAGPTAFQPTTALWSSLWGGINQGSGNWTLAICDAPEWAGDIGNLTSWSMDITYASPVFAAGVWTQTSPVPPPNTMWATAAGPGGPAYIPGTPASSIWVNPTVNTSYNVVVNTATPCTGSLTIPVNVTNPITGLVPPANRTVCVGTNTSFTVNAGGGPLTYQWEVSINNGLTWSAIAGATAATLNVNGVTQLMNNNLYRVTVTASPCGSSTTAPARLNVNELPIVTISSTTLQLVPGRIATITGSSSPAPFSATSWSWTLNGSTIAGATTNTVTANIDQQGAYRATVTDVNGCVGSSNTLTIGSEATDRLWIYPNPNSGQFQVRLYFNGVAGERRIVRIYSTGGQLVAQKEFELASTTPPYMSMSFDLPKLAGGTYAVKVVDRHNNSITSGLVVIQ